MGTINLGSPSGAAVIEIRGTYKEITNVGSAVVNTDGAIKGVDLATILADTNELQTDDIPALIAALPTADENADQVWDELKAGHVGAGSTGEEMQAHALSTEISALNDLSVNDILDSASEIDGLTLREVFAVLAAGIVGQISGAATTTVVIKDHSGTDTRITATVDSDGNRSAITLGLAGI